MMDKKRAKNVYAGYLGLYSFCGDQRRKKKSFCISRGEIKVELESCPGHTDGSTKTLMIVITLSGKIRINVGVSSFYPISLRTSLSFIIRGRRSVVLHSA